MEKIISSFATAIDLQKCKVRAGPRRITLFGGKTKDDKGIPSSQRGTFLLTPAEFADCLLVPEDFSNWNHFGVYSDLLSFEEDVCALVDTVIVFLESPGSIAEFGAFIKNKEIAPKLFVVANGKHDQDSFIQLGLIRYLTTTYPGRTNFVTSQNENLDRNEVAFILEQMRDRYAQAPRLSSFSRLNPRHAFYFLVDFIDVMQVARISDIHLFLRESKFMFKKRRVEQMLLALKNVGFIQENRVLNERCFSLPNSLNLIEYAFCHGVTSKRLSWKAKIFGELLTDKWRAYAYKSLKEADEEVKQEVTADAA